MKSFKCFIAFVVNSKIKKIKIMNIQVLGFVLIGGVFAIGLLVILIYMIFDKTPSRKIPMPPRHLKKTKL